MEKLWLPAFDPLGIIEKLTKDSPVQLKDPLRAALGGSSSPFSVNPSWLPEDVRQELLKSYGEYATKTGEAFAPVGNVQAARAMARTFHEKITGALVR